MGQKVNSNIFRLGYKNNEWDSKYLEKNPEEFALYVYQNLEIKTYIDRFFKRYNLLVNHCKIQRSNETIEIFVSYYITLRAISLINKTNLTQKIIIKQRKKFSNKLKNNYNKKNLKKKKPKKRLWIIKQLKEKLRKRKSTVKIHNFTEKLLESLTLFTKNKLNIIITLQNINKGLSLRLKNNQAQSFRKTIINLRKYSKTLFFRECINILSIVVRKKKSSKLLAEFIAFQFSVIKRHNFFLNFLKRALTLMIKSKFSCINGIKILIKGRLNGKPRSSSRMIQVGKVSLQTFDSNINHFQSISYTPYGTFGIKIWICEK